MINKTINHENLENEIITAVKETTVGNIKIILNEVYLGSRNTVAEHASLQPDNLLTVILGYFYMTFKDLSYSSDDINRIIQKLEQKICTCSVGEAMAAYRKAEELNPLVIAGIIVPSEYWDLKIKDLKYSNIQIAARITKIFSYEGIIYIKDFCNRDINLEKVKYFGKSTFKEFKSALIKTISGDSIADESTMRVG